MIITTCIKKEITIALFNCQLDFFLCFERLQIQVEKYRGNRGCQKDSAREEAHGSDEIRIYHSIKLQC
jgi:hypothetical protein